MKVNIDAKSLRDLVNTGMARSSVGGVLLPDFELRAKDGQLVIEGIAANKSFYLKTWRLAEVEEEGVIRVASSEQLKKIISVFDYSVEISQDEEKKEFVLAEQSTEFRLRESDSELKTTVNLDAFRNGLKLDESHVKFGKTEMVHSFTVDVLTAKRISNEFGKVQDIMRVRNENTNVIIEVGDPKSSGVFKNTIGGAKLGANPDINVSYTSGCDVIFGNTDGDLVCHCGNYSPMIIVAPSFNAMIFPLTEETI